MSTKSTVILFVLTGTICIARLPPENGSARGEAYVLLISGISKDPADQATKRQTLHTLGRVLLERARVNPRRLVILDADDARSGSDVMSPTVGHLRKVIGDFASEIRPEDRFICHYIGQANVVGGMLRFNLPGPDITQKELAGWLRSITADSQVVVLDCPCAGIAAKMLAADGRIIICASTAEQAYATRFTPHFVQALNHPQTDTDGDGNLSLLEVFAMTARAIEQWYRDQQVLVTETPCLEDNGDGVPAERPWRYEVDGGDGANAAAFVFAERP